ncbi:hypothetical protein CRYUN_Cryun10bG0065600 [Craigia yunnanensis]
MESKRFLGCLLIVSVLSFLISSTQCYKFYVGGKDGWVVSPSENYNHWAERNRFQVNDTLCPFFFISGNADNCNKGPKLIIVVMAIRHKPQQHPPSPSPSSVVPATPPVSAPPSPVPKTNPPVETPKSSESSSDLDAPVPAPSEQKSGSLGLVCSTWLPLGYSIWVTIVMGGF